VRPSRRSDVDPTWPAPPSPASVTRPTSTTSIQATSTFAKRQRHPRRRSRRPPAGRAGGRPRVRCPRPSAGWWEHPPRDVGDAVCGGIVPEVARSPWRSWRTTLPRTGMGTRRTVTNGGSLPTVPSSCSRRMSAWRAPRRGGRGSTAVTAAAGLNGASAASAAGRSLRRRPRRWSERPRSPRATPPDGQPHPRDTPLGAVDRRTPGPPDPQERRPLRRRRRRPSSGRPVLRPRTRRPPRRRARGTTTPSSCCSPGRACGSVRPADCAGATWHSGRSRRGSRWQR
jgi:hypothetical protein